MCNQRNQKKRILFFQKKKQPHPFKCLDGRNSEPWGMEEFESLYKRKEIQCAINEIKRKEFFSFRKKNSHILSIDWVEGILSHGEWKSLNRFISGRKSNVQSTKSKEKNSFLSEKKTATSVQMFGWKEF